MKEKYGSDAEEDEEEEDSEDLESEDEDGEELTPAVDAAILRTLARIKRRDPAIYEQGKDVFEGMSRFCFLLREPDPAPIYRGGRQDWRRQDFSASDEGQSTLATPYEVSTTHDASQSKPITIKQQVLAAALDGDFRSPSPEPLTHVAEQDALRKETIAAFHTGEQDDEDDDLLVPREKTKDELEQEEEEYKKKRNPRNYVFGFGRRVCPGAHLIEESLWVVMATMVATLDLDWTRDERGKVVKQKVTFDNAVFRYVPSTFVFGFLSLLIQSSVEHHHHSSVTSDLAPNKP